MLRRRVNLKVSLTLLLSLISLSIPVESFASAPNGADSTQWRFSKQIELESKAAYQQFYLDEEVYGQAAGDLRDLRIVNGKGEYIPFYIDSEAEVTEESVVTYDSSLIRNAKQGRDTLFDYKIIPVRENADIQGDTLVFELPDEAFLKHVQVFGSYDGNTWETLNKSDLYSTDGLNQNRVKLGSTYKFSHYRLLVKDNIENLKFDKLQLLHNNTALRTTSFLRQHTPNYEIKQEGNRTDILVHNNHLKVSKVLLQSTGNFTRRYELLDDKGQGISTKGNGELYRLDFKDARIEATDIVPSHGVSSSSFRIVIYNRDDTPIHISGISTEYLVDKLVFAEAGEGPYQLLYGNVEASTPQYDISNFKTLIEAGDVGLSKLGAAVLEQTITDASAKSNRFLSKMGFNTVIIVVSLLLIIILARKLKA
ncbi:DUF3999 family protein [Paenibacillus wynnii]|uniref:DUF3999 domain-containing protein n=1 Tax=Paenibacillus wynnii TaxID=268407 RepID=A0A098MCD9_9BACL|nr:DUF3999 family protein [Paenibacillus wynnii]KGE20215.1 hypothetical protein PWYN_13400 [Paenibacillus wynnii]